MPDYITYTETPLPVYKLMQTMGKKPAPKMLHDERITKKRLNNPVLWRQLEAISRGTWVNHLGRGHRGRPPETLQY